MFDLVGKRYLFLLISLIVIVPGVISLAFKGLNVGIDFVGGTTIEFRPQTNITITQMTNILKPFKLTDVQVDTGNDTTVTANQTIWIRLNTLVDSNVEGTIQEDPERQIWQRPLREVRQSASKPTGNSRYRDGLPERRLAYC